MSIEINNVLSQIRAMQAQVTQRPAAAATPPAAQPGGFANLLETAVNRVNAAQNDTVRLQEAFAAGDQNTDLSSVMIAGARSQLQFKAMVEVRNRLVSAYQDIMNMPI